MPDQDDDHKAYEHAFGALDADGLISVAGAVSSDAPVLVDQGNGQLRQVVRAHQLNDNYGSIVLELGKVVMPVLRSQTQHPLP